VRPTGAVSRSAESSITALRRKSSVKTSRKIVPFGVSETTDRTLSY